MGLGQGFSEISEPILKSIHLIISLVSPLFPHPKCPSASASIISYPVLSAACSSYVLVVVVGVVVEQVQSAAADTCWRQRKFVYVFLSSITS